MDATKITGYKTEVEVNNQIEVYRMIIKLHSVLIGHNNKKIPSITQEKILAYYCAFGINKQTEEYLIQNKIVSNMQILRNAKSQLHKKGLIRKVKRQMRVVDVLDFSLNKNTSFVIAKVVAKENINLESDVLNTGSQ